ncbi:hypothetical protein [Microbulbifer guangxiensis]|uniref:hypothetical protein n=1 Tax=Microbulbifer guangxiensis TaxID=2904249 RepID=UPI001F25CCB3|nr:hypothetical protein [Microbulbifer guangxiensis]
MEKLITIKQAYLAMAEYLLEECQLEAGRAVDARGIVAELELVGPWESSSEGCTEMFEKAVEKVLTEGSVFDFKKWTRIT